MLIERLLSARIAAADSGRAPRGPKLTGMSLVADGPGPVWVIWTVAAAYTLAEVR